MSAARAARRGALAFAWASLAGLLFSSGRARAEADDIEPTLPTVIQAPFKLFVNHVDHGEVVLVLQEGDVLIAREDLDKTGLRTPPGREVVFGGKKLVSLPSLSPPLAYVLDERDIALRIVAPTELLPSTTVDLGSPPPEISYRSDTSAFLNYAPRVSTSGRVDLYEEVGASIHGHLLFSSAYFSNEDRPVRGLSNFTVDDREQLRRVTLGDALVLTGPLGTGHFVGGATISRNYALNPYVSTAPQLGYIGTTMTPATVDVYVNGSRVRSEQIQPGTFRLDNLRVGGGSGVATYVVRDVFGHEQTISNPFYIAGGVLAKGLSEYTYSVGALRDAIGTQSWDYHTPGALGRHRFGITDHLTLGGRAEVAREFVSAGPSLDALTPIGQVELDLAASRAPGDHSGAAAFLSYSFVSRSFGVGGFGRVASSRYATLEMTPRLDRALVEVGVFHSLPISRRMSFSLQGSLARYRDRGTTARAGAQVAFRIAALWNAVLSGSQARNSDGTTPWEIYAAVSCTFAGGHNATLAGRMVAGAPSLLATANKSLPIGEGYGYRASTTIADRSNVDALVQYQALFGRIGAEYGYDSAQHHASFDAAGALVAVPGVGVFPTLPVQDGFGVIRVPGVRGVRGYVNNQPIGSTDRRGNLLVPNLLSYYGNRLGIAQEDVPLQYELRATEMTVAPPYRGTAVATFPVALPHYYRGKLRLDDHGARIVPKYGELELGREGREPLALPLGEDGDFELDGVTPGAVSLGIEHEDRHCELQLQVPESQQLVVELGEVVCKLK